MKILCLTPWFPSHKEEQKGNFILDSVESLIDLGHEVVVLVAQPWKPNLTKIQEEQYKGKFKIYSCTYFSIPRTYFACISHWFYRNRVNPLLIDLIQKYKCEVIHAHTELAGVCAVDVGKRLGLPSIVTIHGISTEKKLYKKMNKKLLFERTLSKSDRVVLVGKSLIEFCNQFIKKNDHLRIVSNGFRQYEVNSLLNEKKWEKNFLRFISVSNLVDGKGIDLNLLAFGELKKEGIKNWTYKIIGDGVERHKLASLPKKLGLSEHVVFQGRCDQREVYSHLVESDVFILPSYREAFGVAYLEAMSCGLLAIGVKGQGPEAYIENEKNGLLVSPNDVDALIHAMKFIMNSPDKVQEMALKGKHHIHKYFNWHSHAKILEQIYKEAI